MEQQVEVVRLRGAFQIALCDLAGKELQRQIVDNLVVTAGKAFVLKQLQTVNQNTALTLSHIAIGSDTTAPATGNTALGASVLRTAISSYDTTNLTSSTPNMNMLAAFATSDANTTLAEVGVFNSSAAGTMFARATFASFVKATSNTLAITYTVSNS